MRSDFYLVVLFFLAAALFLSGCGAADPIISVGLGQLGSGGNSALEERCSPRQDGESNDDDDDDEYDNVYDSQSKGSENKNRCRGKRKKK